MYGDTVPTSSHSYDFYKDLPAIVQKGLARCSETTNANSKAIIFGRLEQARLRKSLKGIQEDFQRDGSSVDFDIYEIKSWSSESVQAYANQYIWDIVASNSRPRLSPAQEHAEDDLRIAYEAACEYSYGEFEAEVFGGKVVYNGTAFFHRALSCAFHKIATARVSYPDISNLHLETTTRLAVKHLRKKERGNSRPAHRGGDVTDRTSLTGDFLDGLELGKSVDWTRPGGLLGSIVDWMLSQMSRPNRELAVAAAIATIAPVAGWANLYSPTGCSLNVLIAGLGPTAVGKDAMLKLTGRILNKVDVPSKLYSSSDAFSLSAQEGVVYASPATVLALDEIATNMFPRMFSARANSHETAMKGMHMKLWSRNIGDPPYGFTSRGPASVVTLEDAEDPQFSVLAANTPASFWQALPEETIANGYLNRWIIIVAGPRATNDKVIFMEVSAEIVDSLQTIATGGKTGKQFARHKASQLTWESESVRAAWQRMEAHLLPAVEAETTQGHLLGRTAEYAVRLASLHALGRDGPGAPVSMVDLHWGAALASASARAAIAGAAKMTNSEHAKLVHKLEALMAANGEMSMNDITRATRNATPRQRQDALSDLTAMGVIEPFVDTNTGGRNKNGYRPKGTQ